VEPIQGEGGVNVAPDGYRRRSMRTSARHMRPASGPAALDPPRTGAGRGGGNGPVRGSGAAVRAGGRGVSGGSRRARTPRGAVGTTPALGGRCGQDRAALGRAGGLQPARGRRGAGAPTGSAGAGGALPGAPRPWRSSD
jgi:hypothetical protein